MLWAILEKLCTVDLCPHGPHALTLMQGESRPVTYVTKAAPGQAASGATVKW
jgi:hypothetical protein